MKNIHKAQSNLTGSVRKISTGYRVNSAADDAAGLGMGSFHASGSKVYSPSDEEFNDGISVLQTAEGAITEQTNMLVRMRELLVQAGNDVYGTDEKTTYSQNSKIKNRVQQNIICSQFPMEQTCLILQTLLTFK